MNILPSKESLIKFLKSDHEGPLDMVNVLRFKANGRSEYEKYAEAISSFMKDFGMETIYSGDVFSTILGDDDFFHHVIIMRYPSKEKFIEFSSSERWKAIEHHRTEGLESQWLLASKENKLA
tara:strand:+ start:440 stop:805 length:366 start_codon:yes stop_codon:yes gene_type:complete